MAYPYVDFKLPGDRVDPKRLPQRILAMATAYSRRCNPRRMEFWFYSPWEQVFDSLVYDFKELFVNIQHVVYRVRRNGPLDPNASIGTKAEKDTDFLIPDIAVVLARATLRAYYGLPPEIPIVLEPLEWFKLAILTSLLPLICEIKRPPSRKERTAEDKPFEEDLSTLIEVMFQGAILFKSQPLDQDQVTLVAVSGEWFSWRVASKSQYKFPTYPKKGWYERAKFKKPVDEESEDDPEEEEEGEKDDEDANATADGPIDQVVDFFVEEAAAEGPIVDEDSDGEVEEIAALLDRDDTIVNHHHHQQWIPLC